MKLQDIKSLHVYLFNSLISTNCFDELFFAFVSNVVYANDIILNYLKITNCFNELFFAVDFIVVNTTGGILNALNNTTALTSSSFVSEHFLLRITITVTFLQPGRHRDTEDKNIRLQRTKPT